MLEEVENVMIIITTGFFIDSEIGFGKVLR